MTRRVSPLVLVASKAIVAPPLARACEDHSFELPPALITAALLVGFVSVLCLALANPSLAVRFGIFAAFIIAFFTVPAVFVKASPDVGSHALT